MRTSTFSLNVSCFLPGSIAPHDETVHNVLAFVSVFSLSRFFSADQMSVAETSVHLVHFLSTVSFCCLITLAPHSLGMPVHLENTRECSHVCIDSDRRRNGLVSSYLISVCDDYPCVMTIHV